MLAITNAHLHTCGPKGNILGGSLLVQDGRIIAVGEEIAIPSDARVIDVQGANVTPGFIDAHTHMGMGWQELAGEADTNESTGVNNAHLNALDSVDLGDIAFQDALDGGVTAVAILPGKLMIGSPSISPISGQSIVMKMRGNIRGREILRNPAGMKLAVGADVASFLSSRGIGPNSPMGIAAYLRGILDDAERYSRRTSDAGEVDVQLEVLARLLDREFPTHVHVHRSSDILAILRIVDEFGLDVVLHHVTEGYLLAEVLAEKQVSCVVGPTSVAREALPELRNASDSTPGILASAGVQVALMTDHPTDPIQFLPIIAGEAIREGMAYEEALKAITINPARMLGVANRVGSLETGKDADLVIHDGDPLEAMTRIRMVMADGEIVVDHMQQIA
ncbi:hypothetical protein LCGC14_2797250, partial [marine sediment metagenome]